MRYEYVVAENGVEALEAGRSYGSFAVADAARVERGGENSKVYVVDEGRTVAVATSTTGYTLEVAIETPLLDSTEGLRIAQFIARETMRFKRGAW